MVFICHILCISSSRSLYLLFFSMSFSATFLSDGTVISISLQVEFTEYLTMMSGLFAVIILSVLTGMSHMMVMLLSLLCITGLVSGACWYHLSVISISLSLQMLQWRYDAALLCLESTLFWLIPHIQIQYGPLSLHVANTFCICSPLAGHVLLSGSFWCLLPGLELPQVVPLFLLSDYLTTLCWW